MDKSPTTDRHIDVALTSDIKFRDIRNRAKKEEKERTRHSKKYKKKVEKEDIEPKYKIDDLVVIASGMFDKRRMYGLTKIVDIQKSRRRRSVEYFGILLKTTDSDLIDRIGGLISFEQGDMYRWSWAYETIDVSPDSIKWLEKTEEYKPQSEFEKTGQLAHDHVMLVNLLERVYKEHPELSMSLFARVFKEAKVFTLGSEQVKKLNEWYSKLKKQPEGAIGGGLTYSFTPTGLGEIVKIKYFDKELDLSDYENW